MVATVDIQVSASNPTIPLFPWRTFRKSLSSLRIRNVPKRIGKWNITGVSISAKYPSNEIVTHDCTLVGGVWIATMPSCNTAGNVSKGYAVVAKGTDEQGNDVESYILGRGAIQIIDCDIKTSALPNTYNVTLLPDKPDNPSNGDIWLDAGVWYIRHDDETTTLGISKDDVETMLDGYVPKTRKVNGKTLDGDINLTASDVNALGDKRDVTIKAVNPYPASLTIQGHQAGGGLLTIGGDNGAGDTPAAIRVGDKDTNAHGATLTMYGGYAYSGASINLVDAWTVDFKPEYKSEITIGDVKVRESISNLTDKLSPVTGTLADYISTVVTSIYTNANIKEY